MTDGKRINNICFTRYVVVARVKNGAKKEIYIECKISDWTEDVILAKIELETSQCISNGLNKGERRRDCRKLNSLAL